MSARLNSLIILAAAGFFLIPPASVAHAESLLPETSAESVATDYCSNFANVAAETRANVQKKQLDDIKAEIAAKMLEVDKKTAELKEWIDRRDKMVLLASDELLKIYAKMAPEAASLQLEKIDVMTAASILRRLKPKQASDILSAMDVKRASNLAQIIANQTVDTKADKKS